MLAHAPLKKQYIIITIPRVYVRVSARPDVQQINRYFLRRDKRRLMKDRE